MAEGSLLHKILCDMIVAAKRGIYNHGSRCLEALKSLSRPGLSELGTENLTEETGADLGQKVDMLWEFEHRRIVTRVQEILTRQPYIVVDSRERLFSQMSANRGEKQGHNLRSMRWHTERVSQKRRVSGQKMICEKPCLVAVSGRERQQLQNGGVQSTIREVGY
jgi:hypothetical protein